MRYSYYDEFKKEIDGIYCEHPAIKLGIGKKELNINDYRSYEEFVKGYIGPNNMNDLNGYILMKNFEDETIPKDAPFIIEIKAGFQLFDLLKQIKKATKYVNNLQNYDNHQLPKYFIGILCSFSNENTVMSHLKRLNKVYDGSNSKDKDSKINLLGHIIKIIGENINFVIAVLKDGKINNYELSKNDYDINKYYKRVDLLYMYKTINKIDNLSEKDLEIIKEKISTVNENYSKAYHTFNNEKLFSTSYSKKFEYEKKVKEEREEMKKEIKKLQKEKDKMEEKMQEERNKIDEERKEMQKERNQMKEERNKMQEELMKKIQEGRNEIETEKKEMPEEIKSEKKKTLEKKENKTKEDRSQNEQTPEKQEGKK